MRLPIANLLVFFLFPITGLSSEHSELDTHLKSSFQHSCCQDTVSEPEAVSSLSPGKPGKRVSGKAFGTLRSNRDSSVDQFVSPVVDQLLLPDGTGGEDSAFGAAVSVDGLTLLVAAPTATRQGVVRVYDKLGASWVESQIIEPPAAVGYRSFGRKVHLNGDWAFITTYRSINCGSGNNATCWGQEVLVYQRIGGLWSWVDSWHDGGYFTGFGSRIKSHADLLLISAPFVEDSQGNGYQLGALHVYRFDGTQWNKTDTLMPQENGFSVDFASQFAIDPLTHQIAVRENASPTSAVVRVYKEVSGNWQEMASVAPFLSDDSDTFGDGILFFGDSLLVTAPAIPYSNSPQPGAFYVFSSGVRNWSSVQRFTPPDPLLVSRFGLFPQWAGTEVRLIAQDSGSANLWHVFHYNPVSGGLVLSGQSSFTATVPGNAPVLRNFDGGQAVLQQNQDMDSDGYLENECAVLFWDGTAWQTDAVLSPQDANSDDYFSYRMALDGEWLFVSDLSDYPAENQGTVSVYRKNSGQWSKVASLQPADAASMDWFGESLDMAGTRAAIGAPYAGNSGKVYIYDLVSGSWINTATITPVLGQNGDAFGGTVALQGNELLVGAPGTDGAGINGTGGAVYQFEFDGSQWQEVGQFRPMIETSSSAFGTSLQREGDRLLVCDPADNEMETAAGAAYVFEKIGGQWQQAAKIVPDFPEFVGQFCDKAALRGDVLAISQKRTDKGVFLYRLESTGWIKFDQLNRGHNFGKSLYFDPLGRLLVGQPDGSSSGGYFGGGTVYLYEPFLDTWVQSGRFDPASDRDAVMFGYSALMQGEDFFVGAPWSSERGHFAGMLSRYVWTRSGALLGGRVSGLLKGNRVEIGSENIGNLVATTNGVYAYPALFGDFTFYNFAVLAQPDSPIQPCQVENANGMVSGMDIDNVHIVCELGSDLIFRHGLDNQFPNQ